MNNDQDNKHIKVNKTLAAVAVVVILAGLAGWLLGRSDKPSTVNDTSNQEVNTEVTDVSSIEGVKSIVSYSLPDGWQEAGCESSPGSVYVVPAGASDVDCGSNPSSAVKLSLDPGDTKDCNELQNVSDVKKHICISLFINDQRSLKATTEYLASSEYGKDTSVNAYYIDTGKGVVKAEYNFTTQNDYQMGFDQLVNSIKSK